MTIAVAILTTGLVAAIGQHVSRAAPAGQMIVLSNSPSNVVREIVDPATGDRWLLECDPTSPGGPGRLVRVVPGEDGRPQTADGRGHNEEKVLPPRVVRASDRVVVEEHTAVMDAKLEGVALSGARTGATLQVRLKIGGKVVSAVALGPGRVAVTPVTGAQP